MKTLALATDALVMTGASRFERHDDRIVQRTPAEPDFWFGNRVIFAEPPVEVEAVLRRFHADLPQARHVCLSWDVANLPASEVAGLFAGSGLVVESDDTLSLAGDIRQAAAPAGITLGAFRPEDWEQSEEIAREIAGAEERDYPGFADYAARRSAMRRAQIARGLGQWFGAFEGGRLVADMGVFHDARLIRYQRVQTRESHRRQGIASALLGHALAWARARAPEAVAVIVAEAQSDAGRLYRRAGFTLAETTVSAFRPPQ